MDSNTHSACSSDGLTALAAAVDSLAAQDLDGLPDGVRAGRVLELRRLLDRLEGHWLHELAGVDARGAAGAEDGGRPAPPPAGSGPACTQVPAPPAVGCGPPGPCTAAPSPKPPKP
jgi:hypothetical protein